MMGGGNWLAQVGHSRPELAEAAAAQLSTLEYFSCWREYSNDQSIQLAARLADLAPGDLNMVFFTCGGSEGVDTAIKIARRFHHERRQPERTWIMSRRGAYHGTTLGSGSVTGFDDMQYAVGPPLPHIEKVTPPMPYRSELFAGRQPTDFLLEELEQTIHRIGPANIAAMIGEPIMGGAGVIVPPADYWPRVRELLRSHGILLIADEVITAYGRAGEWFYSAAQGMDPDIIVTAKGLTSGYAPLGAVLMSDEIGATITASDTHFFHGHTYFGHPLACALALTNLDLLDSLELPDQATKIGDWLRDALAPAADLSVVGDMRIQGAMVGIELVADPDTREPMPSPAVIEAIDELQVEHHVLARDYGPTLVMGPPLVLEERQAKAAAAAVIDVLSRLELKTH
jgi:putrescine aminotransferase